MGNMARKTRTHVSQEQPRPLFSVMVSPISLFTSLNAALSDIADKVIVIHKGVDIVRIARILARYTQLNDVQLRKFRKASRARRRSATVGGPG